MPKSPHTVLPHTAKQQLQLPHELYDTDCEDSTICQPQQTGSLHPNVLTQIEKMLQKALKQTSDHITEKLTKEIRDLGRHTAELENRVDDIETNVMTHETELDTFKDENFSLQTRLEDFENRAHRSNHRVRGIPESIIDLQSTITALFQELSPSIPIERPEIEH